MNLTFALVLLACRPPEEDLGPRQPAPEIVPHPAALTRGYGVFRFDGDTVIGAEPGAERVAEALAAQLRAASDLPLPVEAEGAVQLALLPEGELPAEGYRLEVGEDAILLAASDEAGLFYAAQTLRQLLPPESLAGGPAALEVGGVLIEDAPRFGWRGYMLDVARHFFTTEEVARQIDLMALHKLNRLHLHLTDDQGWRLEIEGRPELTQIGGATEVGGGPGGWYTQAELAELADYAAARHVILVPEIDLPGHAHAALASTPGLNEDGVAPEPYTGTPVISSGLSLQAADTEAFVADVWTQVAAATPGPYVHIGGDEVLGMSPEDYATFIGLFREAISAEGKTLVGWDELAEAEVGEGDLVQYWIDLDRARSAVDRGARLIVSPARQTYLDMRPSLDETTGQTWAGIIDTAKAYDWEPVPRGMDEAAVYGVEAPLWTEFVADEARVDWMTWPRLAAIAEVGWTPAERREREPFLERLGAHGARLDALGVGYHPDPVVPWE